MRGLRSLRGENCKMEFSGTVQMISLIFHDKIHDKIIQFKQPRLVFNSPDEDNELKILTQ